MWNGSKKYESNFTTLFPLELHNVILFTVMFYFCGDISNN